MPPTVTPIEPGLRSRSRVLKVPIPVVSDSPYPSRIVAPNASSKPFRTSTGSGDPPEMHRFKLETSWASRSGWLSNAEYIVGTPPKVVTWSRSMISSTFPGSKRGTSVIRPRALTVVFMIEFIPNTWNSGSVATTTESESASTRSRPTSEPQRRFLCVSAAPLGVPVVPEV